jgi:hypothetical protein
MRGILEPFSTMYDIHPKIEEIETVCRDGAIYMPTG